MKPSEVCFELVTYKNGERVAAVTAKFAIDVDTMPEKERNELARSSLEMLARTAAIRAFGRGGD